MDNLVMVTVAAAWLAIFGMLVFGVVARWRVMMGDDGRLPIFGVLARRGLALERLERSPESFAVAVRRCAMCGDKARCGAWLEGRAASPALLCPNEAFLEAAARA